MKLTILSAVFFLFLASCQGLSIRQRSQPDSKHYVITAPKIFLGEENVCLTIFDRKSLPEEAKLKVQLRSLEGTTIFETEEELTSDSQCVRVPVDEVKGSDRAILRVKVEDEIEDEREIAVRPHAFMTFIETSKALYRPHEVAKIRLVTFDRKLKPVDQLLQRVWVENSRGLVVMEWNNIRTTGGITSLSVPLSQDNLFGTWKIKAVAEGNILVAEKSFRVDEIEEPEVVIEVKDEEYISATEDRLSRTICVKDKFGAPLEGKITVRAGYERLNPQLPMDVFTADIQGCIDVPINATLLGLDTRVLPQRSLTLDIEFENKEQNLIQQRSLELPIAPRSLLVQFPSTKIAKPYFKHGAPYFGQVQLLRPDLTPTADKKVKIFVEARKQPWTQEEDQKNKYEVEMTSDFEGKVDFELPAFTEEIKQVLVKVEPLDHPEHSVAFALRPWFSETKTNLVIKPAAQDALCADSAELELYVANTERPVEEVYYQVIGRGYNEAPKKTSVRFEKWTPANQFQRDVQEKQDSWVAKLRVELPQDKSSLTPMTRVVVFFKEENKEIVADSHSFIVDCLHQGINFKLDRNQKTIEMDLQNQRQGVKCAVEMSTDKQRSLFTKQKVMNLLERFDINHEYMQKDRCEQRRLQGQKSPSFVHREQEMSPFKQTVLDYSDSWDAFNDAGLHASSNFEINNSPCEEEVYTEGVPSEVLKGMENERHLLWTGASRDESNARSLQKIEESMGDDLIYWNSHINRQQFQHNEDVSEEHDVYASAVCFDDEQGLRFAAHEATCDKTYHLKADAPKRAITGETVTLRVHIQKKTEKNLPLKIKIKTTTPDLLEIIEEEQEKCIESKHEIIRVQLKPQSIGRAYYEVEATRGSISCQNEEDRIESTTSSRKSIAISARGVEKKSTKTQLICSKDEKQRIEVDGVKSATISADLVQIVSKHAKKTLESERSALDVLSSLAPFVYLTKDSETKASVKQEMQKEMIKAYQSLITYRLPDGSYSLFGGRKAIGDLALTTAIVKVLSQAQSILPYTNDHELGKSINWIYSQQKPDGCFEAPQREISFWPLNIKDNEELTAFVVSSLLEAGHSVESAPMINGIQCAKKTIESEQKASEKVYAILAYVESKKDNREEARSLLQKLEEQYGQEVSAETLAYMTLTKEKLDEEIDAEQVAQTILSSKNVWESPIKTYTLIKIWRKLQTPDELKVKYSGSAFTLRPFNKRQFELKSDDQIKVEGTGCALLFLEKSRSLTSTESKNFKVTVSGTDRGYGSCQKRLVKICLKERKESTSSAPVIKMQIVSGFKLDKKYLKQSLLVQRPTLLNHFRVQGRDAYLYLKFLKNPALKSQCLDVPLIQIEEVAAQKEGYIQIYDYHQGSLEVNQEVDSLSYTIPQECEVIPVEGKSLEKRPFSWTNVQTHNYNAGPLRVVNCPENVDVSCPVCENYDDKMTQEVCSSKVAALTSRLPYRQSDYKFLPSESSSQKCVAVPLHLQVRMNDKEIGRQQLPLFMRADCICPSLVQRNMGDSLMLVKNSNFEGETESKGMQLTSEDKIIRIPAGDRLPTCGRLNRSRREAEICEDRSLNSCPTFVKTLATFDRAAACAADFHENITLTRKNKCTVGVASSEGKSSLAKFVFNQECVLDEFEDKKKVTWFVYGKNNAIDTNGERLLLDSRVTVVKAEVALDCSNLAPQGDAPAPYATSYAAPAYSAPAYSAPAYSAPSYSAPSYSAPAYQAPSYSAPSYSAPAYPAPSYSAPAYSAPSYSAPAYSAPSYSAPAYSEPAYSAPSYSAPSYPAPSYAAPAYPAPAPAYSAPAYQAPSYSAPSYSAPSYSAPSYSAPSYSAPSYSAPSYSAPAYQAPSYSAPSYSAPAYSAPSYSAPAYPAPAPAYSAPSYSAPSYSAPAYSAPAYQAPSYAPSYSPAPSYSAPQSYEQPTYGYMPSYNSYDTPSYSAPSYSAPAYPAPSYSAPAYSAPSYPAPAPAYSAPSYSAPSYSAPAYSAPAYQAPSYAPMPSYDSYTPSYSAPSYSAPAYQAPSYSAPSYPAPAYSAPSYSAPSYSAPSYSAPSYSAPSYSAPSYPASSYPAPSYSAPTSYGYASESAPLATYTAMGSYGSSGVEYPHTQPFYAYPQYQDYRTPPGFLRTGYFEAKSSQDYGSASSLHPVYYYRGSGRSYFGPWYKPAQLVLPSNYNGYQSNYPASRDYSSYARRYGHYFPQQYAAASSVVPSFSAAPNGFSSGVQSYGYAVPVSTSNSYGYGSYDSTLTPVSYDNFGLTSYARPYYAAASTKQEVAVDADKCAPAATSCPVCENYVTLEAIGKFCTFKNVFMGSARVERDLSNDQTTCARMTIDQIVLGKQGNNEVKVSLKPGCSCPVLEEDSSEVIILAPQHKSLEKKHFIADHEVYIVKKTESTSSDVHDLQSRCNAVY